MVGRAYVPVDELNVGKRRVIAETKKSGVAESYLEKLRSERTRGLLLAKPDQACFRHQHRQTGKQDRSQQRIPF